MAVIILMSDSENPPANVPDQQPAADEVVEVEEDKQEDLDI